MLHEQDKSVRPRALLGTRLSRGLPLALLAAASLVSCSSDDVGTGDEQNAEASTVTRKLGGWWSSGGKSTDGKNPRFVLDVPTTGKVNVTLSSATVDTYLQMVPLSAPAGQATLYQDDNGGGGTNSKLSVQLTKGKYLVIAQTVKTGVAGDFVLESSTGTLSACVMAYKDKDFAGDASLLCAGQPFVMDKDTYSSVRVPKGAYVRFAQHSDDTGWRRTYYRDTPSFGYMNDSASFAAPGDFRARDFFMAVVSDPQFSWRACDDDGSSAACKSEKSYFSGDSDEKIARTYNQRLVSSITSIRGSVGEGAFAGMIVNGDLTEFGQMDSDLDDYRSTYPGGFVGNVYPGLGNHDYENCVNDCSLNTCARGTLLHLRDEVQSLNPTAFDYAKSTDDGVLSDTRKHRGSFAYSFDLGDVHFVQLNNYPTYTKSFDARPRGVDILDQDDFSITSSVEWLRADLRAAAGKKLVLNLHDWTSAKKSDAFLKLLADYPVSAVFAGHYHGVFARQESYKAGTRTVPVYLSGAPHYGQFMLTRYVDGKLYVWMMALDNFAAGGPKLRVQKGTSSPTFTEVTPSNMSAVFSVTGATQYFQYSSTLY